VGRTVEIDLGRHDPLAATVADERVAHALDRLPRRHSGENGLLVEDGCDVAEQRSGLLKPEAEL
jgi:hypothetical protein